MLISDWSSDVCSSDLCLVHDVLLAHRFEHASSSGADESAAWVRCRLAFVPPHGPPAWPGARLDHAPGHDRAQCAARRRHSPAPSRSGRTRSDETTTGAKEIGRAHVRTPVTNAHLVCSLLLDKKNDNTQHT